MLVESQKLQEDIQIIEEIINSTFEETNKVFNNWNSNSEISKLNAASAGVEIDISEQVRLYCHVTNT